MLAELIGMVRSEEITEDRCQHLNPAEPEIDFCRVCFIKNHETVSIEDPEFTNETTELQRETIESLWNQHADDGDGWD